MRVTDGMEAGHARFVPFIRGETTSKSVINLGFQDSFIVSLLDMNEYSQNLYNVGTY